MNRLKIYMSIRSHNNGYRIELSQANGYAWEVNLGKADDLEKAYGEWSEYYNNYYGNSKDSLASKAGSGTGSKRLAGAKKEILTEKYQKLSNIFESWFRNADLLEKLNAICKTFEEVYIYIKCDDNFTIRLPWEDYLPELLDSKQINLRVFRIPTEIVAQVTPFNKLPLRNRILVITGQWTNINFNEHFNIFKNFKKINVVRNNDQSIEGLKELIEDQEGWDMLYFVGHNSENRELGGSFTLDQNNNISYETIKDSLNLAVKNGLKFIFFNACNGIDWGNRLIRDGFPQVIVMREIIHKDAAFKLLEVFTNELNQGRDISEALSTVCKSLKKDHSSYPSTYLIPSLFCHPDAELFKLNPPIYQKIYHFLPSNSLKLVALGSVLLTGLIPHTQSRIIEVEQAIISILRTDPTPLPSDDHKLVLLHIDRESLDASDLTREKPANPINKQYLANLVDELSQAHVKSIAIDYILDPDKSTGNNSDRVLKHSIEKARNKNINFLLASIDPMSDHPSFATLTKGDINFSFFGNFPQYIQKSSLSTNSPAPFAYFLAESLRADEKSSQGVRNDIDVYNSKIEPPFYLQWLASPIIDYSKYPNDVYTRISAKQLFDKSKPLDLKNKVVLIAAGGYDDAGVTEKGEDNYPLPLSISILSSSGIKNLQGIDYFYIFFNKDHKTRPFSGSEIHAYIAHQLLTNSIIFRVSDWLIILMSIPIGGWCILKLRCRHNLCKWLILVVSPLAYLASCLLLYCSFNIAIPFGLPLIVYIIYVAPDFGIRKRHVTN